MVNSVKKKIISSKEELKKKHCGVCVCVCVCVFCMYMYI